MKPVPPQINEVRPERINYEESPRLRRIRAWAQLLDQSIVLPGGYRIGIDAIIGLIPGLGDLVGTGLSFFLVYQAARLGISKKVVLRMTGNVLIEALVGEIPILGDIFDAVWKANMRNLKLVELHHRPLQPQRSARSVLMQVALLFFAVIVAALLAMAGLLWFVLRITKVGFF